MLCIYNWYGQSKDEQCLSRVLISHSSNSFYIHVYGYGIYVWLSNMCIICQKCINIYIDVHVFVLP